MMIHWLPLKSYINNIKIFSSLIWLWGTGKWNPGIRPIRRHGSMPTSKISLAYLRPDGTSDNWNKDHSKNNNHVFLLKDRRFEKDDNSGYIMEKWLCTRGNLALVSQVPNSLQKAWVLAKIQLRKLLKVIL